MLHVFYPFSTVLWRKNLLYIYLFKALSSIYLLGKSPSKLANRTLNIVVCYLSFVQLVSDLVSWRRNKYFTLFFRDFLLRPRLPLKLTSTPIRRRPNLIPFVELSSCSTLANVFCSRNRPHRFRRLARIVGFEKPGFFDRIVICKRIFAIWSLGARCRACCRSHFVVVVTGVSYWISCSRRFGWSSAVPNIMTHPGDRIVQLHEIWGF
jgi:hypothetical protein